MKAVQYGRSEKTQLYKQVDLQFDLTKLTTLTFKCIRRVRNIQEIELDKLLHLTERNST